MAKIVNNNVGYLDNDDVLRDIPQKIKRTQVYQVTHKGELRLPFMDRSFISFSFGGKVIEDFGIIRVTGGDRVNDIIYADFQDITQQYNVLDGQFYWGTHIKPLEVSFTLSTDGMTQRQLDDFKHWFAPGKTRELILAQHPNRAVMARVSGVPSMSMIPFKSSQKKKIARTSYQITTTLYKGDITLTFISDDPFWYSICNLIGDRYRITSQGAVLDRTGTDATLASGEYYQYRWIDANGQYVNVMSNDDALKIILQDNIPCANMVQIYDRLFLGDNFVITNLQYSTGDSVSALVAQEQNDPNPPYGKVGVSRVGAVFAPSKVVFDFEQGSFVDLIPEHSQAYLYYAGNAPSYPIIRFILTPIFSSQAPYYLIAPQNGYSKGENLTQNGYDCITIKSEQQHQFRFSTPSAWSGYNQVMYWLKTMAQQGVSLQDTKVMIRDNVNHWAPRAWAIAILECLDTIGKMTLVSGTASSETQISVSQIYNCMKLFLSTDPTSTISNYSSKFYFNTKNGVSKGILTYKVVGNLNSIVQNSTITNIYNLFKTFTTTTVEENVGDMVKSNYILLEETNHLNENGEIVPWTENDPKTTHMITTSYPYLSAHTVSGQVQYQAGLSDFSIEYQNMYH